MNFYTIVNGETHTTISIDKKYKNVIYLFLNELENDFDFINKSKNVFPDHGHNERLDAGSIVRIYRYKKELAEQFLKQSVEYCVAKEEKRKKQNRFHFSINQFDPKIIIINSNDEFEKFNKKWLSFITDLQIKQLI